MASDQLERLPRFTGRPIRICFLPNLTANGRDLETGTNKGAEVHAGTNLTERWIALDRALLGNPREFRRIFTHELFHFVWMRLGNPRRASFEALLAAEFAERARGELGWSAQSRKDRLAPGDVRRRNRKWRDYLCEAFCDTAAWVLAGPNGHPEYTLADRWKRLRRAWWRNEFGPRRVPI